MQENHDYISSTLTDKKYLTQKMMLFCLLFTFFGKYRVIQKKLFHKSEEKMQEKMKMILQKNENLVHIQQQYGVSFCE